MPPKGRKSLSTGWYNCESCGDTLTHKDLQKHSDNCPTDIDNWNHPFIRNNTLFSYVEYFNINDALKVSPQEQRTIVYLSQSAMQLCNFEIGEKVLLVMKNGDLSIRTVWPTSERTLTSVIFLPSTQEGYQHPIEDKSIIIVRKMTNKVIPAFSIGVVTTQCLDSCVKDQISKLFKQLYAGKLVFLGQELVLPFYGKNISFTVNKIEGNNMKEDILNKFAGLNIKEDLLKNAYLVGNTSKWNIVSGNTNNNVQGATLNEITLEMVGGYKGIVEELLRTVSLILKGNSSSVEFSSTLGILLHGASGTGKSFITRAIAKELNVPSIMINSGELFSKFYGEAENRLLNLFNEAKSKSPSIIIIDNIDALCSKKSGTEQEKRVSTYFISLLDSLRGCKVVVLSTTSQPNSIDSVFRRPGRLDFEIELPIPTVDDRFQILKVLLSKWMIDESEVLKVASAAHGYVAADLTSLVNKALMRAVSHGKKHIETSDLYWALSQIKPSAMREVQVQVPHVRWDDIGGMDNVKLKLQQAVEWPLNHSESFTRLGITPPCGVLMFGPPGCSKTMIAKAVATESNLNFISVKGSDLFSKWVGESEKAIQLLFKKARAVAPSIIFFDEIDAIGGTRSASNEGSNVQERVLAQLLTEMDGVEPLKNVNIIAATNRPDRIDKALMRPGRLDRLIYVPLPDLTTRKSILQLQLAKMPVSTDISVDDLSLKTEGYSGAEVIAVCHEAAINALQENLNLNEICARHFTVALENVKPRTPKSLLNLYESYLK